MRATAKRRQSKQNAWIAQDGNGLRSQAALLRHAHYGSIVLIRMGILWKNLPCHKGDFRSSNRPRVKTAPRQSKCPISQTVTLKLEQTVVVLSGRGFGGRGSRFDGGRDWRGGRDGGAWRPGNWTNGGGWIDGRIRWIFDHGFTTARLL